MKKYILKWLGIKSTDALQREIDNLKSNLADVTKKEKHSWSGVVNTSINVNDMVTALQKDHSDFKNEVYKSIKAISERINEIQNNKK